MSTPYRLHHPSMAGSRQTQHDRMAQSIIFNSETGMEIDLEDDHPELYLSETIRDRIAHDVNLTERDKSLIQRLACRKFHIPGQTFWQDYWFWCQNNHPFLCFCFADPRHPLGKPERILNLLSSLAFGLAATCSAVLWFYNEADQDFNSPVFSMFGLFNVTEGMLALLVLGGPSHVLFDIGLFFLQACPPCRPGGFLENWPRLAKVGLWFGAHLAFLLTITCLTLAIMVALMRASVAENDGDDENLAKNPKCYSFMLVYCLEVVVANFVAFPICVLIVFSTLRPFQVRKHQALLEKRRRKSGTAVV